MNKRKEQLSLMKIKFVVQRLDKNQMDNRQQENLNAVDVLI